jgi:hypothetical protein
MSIKSVKGVFFKYFEPEFLLVFEWKNKRVGGTRWVFLENIAGMRIVRKTRLFGVIYYKNKCLLFSWENGFGGDFLCIIISDKQTEHACLLNTDSITKWIHNKKEDISCQKQLQKPQNLNPYL